MALLSMPLTFGHTWCSTDSDGHTTCFQVVAANDTVNTPAGEFTGCKKICETWSHLPDQDYFWFKPGVGLVQMDTYEGSPLVLKEHRQLVGYYLVPTDDLVRIRQLPDESPVFLSGLIVSASWSDAFYLESEDRHSGIRVEKEGHGLYKDDRADVCGTIKTNGDGERYIQASDAVYSGNGTVKPLGLILRDIGGSDWRYDEHTGAGQRGVTGGTGLNNVGLLVRTWGKVKDLDPGPDPSWCVIGDGPGVDVRCETPSGVTLQMDSIVQVTGISRLYKTGDEYTRRISISDADDIVVLKQDPPPAPDFMIGMIEQGDPNFCSFVVSWPAFATSMDLYRSSNGTDGWVKQSAVIERFFEGGHSYGSTTIPGENAYYRMTGVNSGGEGAPGPIVHTRPAQVEIPGVICDSPPYGAVDVSLTPTFSWHAAWTQPTAVKCYVCQLDGVSGIDYWPIWRVLTALSPPQTSVTYGQSSDVVVSLPATGLAFNTLYQWDICAVDAENFIFAQSQKMQFTTQDAGPPPPPP